MTDREFLEFLNSFNKKPGEYTRNEAFEIGKAFKDLDVKPMTWRELAKKLGYLNGEALRGLVKNRLTKDGLLNNEQCIINKVQDKVLNNEPIDNDELSEEIDQKLATVFKEQVKYKDLLTAYKRKLRDEARIEVMKDAIRENVATQWPLTNIVYIPQNAPSSIVQRTGIPNEAVLLLSDLHIGVECNNFYNKYNSHIASQRLSLLVVNVVDYCQRNKVQRLNILNLGDMIHGVIHVNARIEQEFDVINQVKVASELLAQSLNLLQQAAPEIIYRSCTDNHSRVTPNKSEHIEKENFYQLIDWYLEERLKGTNIKFVKDNLDIGLGRFNLLNGKKLAFSHGHEDNLSTTFQNLVGATREYIDYICMGHFHCEKVKSFQDAKVIVNGSIVGTEQYALSKRLFSHPSQLLLVFEGTNLNTISIDLTTKE